MDALRLRSARSVTYIEEDLTLHKPQFNGLNTPKQPMYAIAD